MLMAGKGKTSSLVVAVLTFALLLCQMPRAHAEDLSESAALRFFEQQVRPLLAEHCWKCHGPEKQRGGLRLDSREAILSGGESGPAVEPGNPQESLLISAVHYEGLQMPPTGRLPDEAIAVLERWVRLGAPWPQVVEGSSLAVRPKGKEITPEDRAHWAYQPLRPIEVPEVSSTWARTPVDAFIEQRLAEAGLEPAPAADKRELVRRAYFDLWGLPPTAEQVEAFVADQRPDAFARLVDQLLEHPNYGRHWARHWLDLVRYAESDGYKQDAYRPSAYRYRDYVIDAFNTDKPYNQFVIEQLAGDELAPGDPQVLAATGFLRHTIYEYNQRDVRTQWHWMISEVVDVTAEVFLAVGLGCARCHDHKFDPIPQRDYYRFRAYFEPMVLRDDVPAVADAEYAAYQRARLEYEAATADLRHKIAAIEAPFRQKVADAAIDKFPKDVRPMLRKSPVERTPYEEQIARLAWRQVELEQQNLKMDGKLQGQAKEEYDALCRQLAQYDAMKPAEPPCLMSVSDVGPEAPPTWLGGPDGKEAVEPGTLSVLDLAAPAIVAPHSQTTGRRLALARWMVDPRNPLTARVIVNRVWQYHFGQGLVATSSDFGRLGEGPSHPELLDWLAAEFMANGWSLKWLHRLIMTSAVYQQGSRHPNLAAAMAIDPQNRLLWHWRVRRLTAEQIRDSLLLVSGQLVDRGAGPSSDYTEPVRSIYLKVWRNQHDPLLEVFDAPDGFSSVAQRHTTTTPLQALLMMNNKQSVAIAAKLASRALAVSQDDQQRIDWLCRTLFGRPAEETDLQVMRSFLEKQAARVASEAPQPVEAAESRRQAWVDLCHVLLNSSEFLYVE
ncbi:MAG: cytochrome c [Pirellulaceae bacterium]|nr:MAG: cytochrome c [Pirellulaceae bacterium]